MVSQRFSPKERKGYRQGGRILEIASILTERSNSSDPASGERDDFKREQKRGKTQENILEEWAKSDNCWISNTDKTLTDLYGEYIARGGEATVHYNGSTVIKAIGLDYYISPQLALDRIVLNNFLFGSSTPLTVLAFGRNSDGAFQVIVEQPFIQGSKLSESEIGDYASNMGFALKSAYSWTYLIPGIYISDLHDENVLRTKGGNIAVIDAELRLN